MIEFLKCYRGKERECALITTSRTKQIKKNDVRQFVKLHFPQVEKLKVRICKSYRYGSKAIVTAKTELWK